MATITLNQVSKLYPARKGETPSRAVDNVNMHIGDGEIVALLGSSGCGKTSTLRMIAGFEDVSEGEVRIGARVVNSLKPARRNVAMAFEGYALYPPLKVSQNIGFSLLRDRIPRAEINQKVKMVSDLLEINDLLELYPPTLSGGQQQRVSLARALVRKADAYLLDEPMSQLEPQLRAVLRARIKDYLIANRMTSVFVTHDQTEAIALADRIAVMSNGVLQQLGSPADLQHRPSNYFVASFIGEPPMNLFAAEIVRDGGGLTAVVANAAGQHAFRVVLPHAAVAAQLRPGQRIHLGIRPHQVEVLGADADGGATGPSVLRGELATNQWLGDQSHLGIDIGGAVVMAVVDRGLALVAGSRVALDLPLRCLHFFDAESGVALLHGSDLAD